MRLAKLFSVALKGDDGKSKLIIGEPDPTYFKNDIVWGDVIQPSSTGMWFTQLTGILTTQGATLDADEPYFWMDACQDTAPCLALIDTGTSYITMPSGVYNKLIDHLVQHTKEGGKAKCMRNRLLIVGIQFLSWRLKRRRVRGAGTVRGVRAVLRRPRRRTWIIVVGFES